MTTVSSYISPAPPSPLFPYTTLFRSRLVHDDRRRRRARQQQRLGARRQKHRAEARLLLHAGPLAAPAAEIPGRPDRKSTRLNSSHLVISYAVSCLKKKTTINNRNRVN